MVTIKNRNYETEVYSSVPFTINIENKEECTQKMINLLYENRPKFFKTRVIAKECGFKVGGTQVEVRKAITELIEIDKLPIVGNGAGYAWAVSKNMVKFYLEHLEFRAKGLQNRIDSVKEIEETWQNGG